MSIEAHIKVMIEEKGTNIDSEITIPGHFGFTYGMLILAINQLPDYHETIKKTLTKIDYKNGDIFHYLKFLAVGICENKF